MRIAIECILLAISFFLVGFSVAVKRIPRGLLEWGIWILTAVLIVLHLIGI